MEKNNLYFLVCSGKQHRIIMLCFSKTLYFW